MRELRREGVMLGVDLRGCFEKAQIIEKLKAAKRTACSGSASFQMQNGPHAKASSIHDPSSDILNGQTREGKETNHATPAETPGPVQPPIEPPDKQPDVETQTDPGETVAGMDGLASATGSDHRGRAEAEQIQTQPSKNGNQQPEETHVLKQRDELTWRQGEPDSKEQGDMQGKPQKEQQQEEDSWPNSLKPEAGSGTPSISNGQTAKGKDKVASPANAVSGCSLEVVPMRTLIKECKLLGIDSSGLYSKCEVISKLIAVLNQTVSQVRAPATTVLPEVPLQEVQAPGHEAQQASIPEHKVEPEVEPDAGLPEPRGPPVVLSPFNHSTRAKPAVVPKDKDTFNPWAFVDPVVEEELDGRARVPDESEEDAEEIIMDAQEWAPTSPAQSGSSSLPRQQPQTQECEDDSNRLFESQEIHKQGTVAFGDVRGSDAVQDAAQDKPTSPTERGAFAQLRGEEVPSEAETLDCPARPRASISELFRLTLSELEARCIEVGVPVSPGDAKGVLISRLKQAMSKPAVLQPGLSAAQPQSVRSTQQLDTPDTKPLAEATKASESVLDSPTRAPSFKREPEMFNIGSDDGSGADDQSDTDFFPDLNPAPASSVTEEHAEPTAVWHAASDISLDSLPRVEEEQASIPKDAFSTGAGPSEQSLPAAVGAQTGPEVPAGSQDPQDQPSSGKEEEPFLPDSGPSAAWNMQEEPRMEEMERPGTEKSTVVEEACDQPQAQERDTEFGAEADRRDSSMFDFDDLDEAEADSPAEQPAVRVPEPPHEEPAKKEGVSAATSTVVDEGLNSAPAEPHTSKEASKEPGTAPDASQGTPGADSTPLLRFSTKELLELARSRGVDVRGCVEKSDIVERLTRTPRAQPPAKSGATPQRNQSVPAPTPASPFVSHDAARRPKAPSKGMIPEPARAKSKATSTKPSAKAARAQPPPWGNTARKADQAPRPEPQPQPAKAPPQRAPGEIPSCWSARVQTWFGRYPGFSALLPPEAEMWTDQELDVYFGSNGDIWPRGKRPAWFGRASFAGDDEPKPTPKSPGPRTYPDLKVHFQTLDLAETTPPEIIRRHYRRLARDCHPDKHPDNVEEATRKFQQITEAYEAIANRLKL